MSEKQKKELMDKLNQLSDTELTYVVGMAEGMMIAKMTHERSDKDVK